MQIQLINGKYSDSEINELLRELIQVKIRFHTQKITQTSVEEEIKMREMRIKQLQIEYHNAVLFIQENKSSNLLNCELNIL